METTLSRNEFTAQELAENMGLEIIYDTGKPIHIEMPNVNRIGLQLAGDFENFTSGRVQVVGPSEVNFLGTLRQVQKETLVNTFFENDFPCMVFSRNLHIDDLFLENAKHHNIPLFRS